MWIHKVPLVRLREFRSICSQEVKFVPRPACVHPLTASSLSLTQLSVHPLTASSLSHSVNKKIWGGAYSNDLDFSGCVMTPLCIPVQTICRS